MPELDDPIDAMRTRLAELYTDLDTTAFGVTGHVLRLAAWFERQRADHLEPFGLTPGDVDVLATIGRTESEAGVDPRVLVAAVLITSGGLTKRLDRLEAAGLIGRRPDPNDRRGTLIRLTTHGTDLIDRALPSLLTRGQELITATLTNHQIHQATTLLRKLTVARDA
jgi:DNA-binding MarR family transcriptional regulator